MNDRYYVTCSLWWDSADLFDRLTGRRLTSVYQSRDRMLAASTRLQQEADERNWWHETNALFAS